MATTSIPPSLQIIPKRYGITEAKKAELDNLSILLADAQQNVDQYQVIVQSLSLKVQNFQSYLAAADANRTLAYNNKVLIDQMVQSAHDLEGSSILAFTESVDASAKIRALTSSINAIMGKLIYSADLVNKLSALVTRKKAMNPLISDDLVSWLVTAGKDANTAVSLTLVALKAVFAAMQSNMELEASLSLENQQAGKLTQWLTGTGIEGKDFKSLKDLIYQANTDAMANYKQMERALKLTTSQLNAANSDLSKAQVKLKSLQAGYAAANAAALAS
jgi:hypothetical protein